MNNFCFKCNRDNPPYAVFCSMCGNNLRIQKNNENIHNINLNVGRQYNPYRTNSYALWSLILACISFLFGWAVVAVIAIVLGNTAKNQIASSNEQGMNLATTGIILGWVNIGLTIAAIFFIIIFTAGLSAYVGNL